MSQDRDEQQSYDAMIEETYMDIKALTLPWSRDEVRWRAGSYNSDKTKALPLAYVDARSVMDRLDNIVGAANWQDRYEFHGSRIICYLSIKINDEWITKADGAGDSNVEAEKGGISDAFKRAAVKWGMGRELYELKCKWMPIDAYKQIVGDPWNNLVKGDIPPEDAPKVSKAPKVVTPKDTADRLIAKAKEFTEFKTLKEWTKLQAVIDARDKLFIEDKTLSDKVEAEITKLLETLP